MNLTLSTQIVLTQKVAIAFWEIDKNNAYIV